MIIRNILLWITTIAMHQIAIAQSMSPDAEYNKAVGLLDIIQREQRYIMHIEEMNELDYPVGLLAEGSNKDYAVLLSKDEIQREGSLLSAYMLFVVPQSGDTLGFAAHAIPLDAEGGITGDVNLTLIKPVPIQLGSDITLTILGGENGSKIIFGCGGFKSMTIRAQLELSSDIFVRENPTTGEITGEKISVIFTTTLTNWNDMLVAITLPPFQLRSLPGFGFELQDAVLDLSDYINPTGSVLPSKYSSFFPGGNLNLWQGIYVKNFIMRMPPELSKNKKNSSGKTSSERTAIYASNLFIDSEGLTGIVGIDGLLTMDEGDMHGWSFSVDRFDLSLEMSTLTAASFRGKLKIPMLDSVLLYQASLGVDGNYLFSVTTTSKQSFNLWAADMQLDPNSIISIRVKDGKFLPSARLNGSLTINADLSGSNRSKDKESNISLAAIKFENLELQTEKPYIKGGLFSLGSDKAKQAMANFPLQIDSIFVAFNENTATLGTSVKISILGQNEGDIAAASMIRINAEHVTTTQQDCWQFKNVEIGLLSINATLSAFSFRGNLMFFKDDPEYGKGFQGQIWAGLKLGEAGIDLKTNAIFGKVNNFKYWYFDALATVSTGLPVFPGLAIYGFGGGAYYHMQQVGTAVYSKPTLGVTNTGLIYKPTDSVFLGLKATVIMGTLPSKEIFNGNVTLEIAFNNRMGIKYVSLIGDGYFITSPIGINSDVLKSNTLAMASGNHSLVNNGSNGREAVRANVNIRYDFDNNVLHGNLKVFMNVAGIIKGSGPNNLAGDAELYFSNSDWYIYIGTPDAPVGISMANIANTSSYFMMGTRILGSPPPPAKVTEILHNPQYATYMDELNSIRNCSGIAFGSRLQMNTGDVSFLMFYGNLDAAVGFDVALKNYGNATCVGTSSVIGINGWYANGQAYGYMQGRIGVRVKIFGFEKKATIVEGGMATILQAQMPNPIYMQGAVGGYFSVLDGLVSGHFDFSFTLGEKCEIQGGSPLNNVNVIAKITPDDNADNVDVFTSPQAVFNYAIDTSFELVDLDNKKHRYRIKLDYFNIYDGSALIAVNYRWSDDKKTLALLPSDILPGQKSLKLKVQVVFEELVNNSWQVVQENGSPLEEMLETSFTTDKAPDYIPHSNVAYSYPIINQLNYYKDETTEGYIKLRQGQDYLFENTDNMATRGRFTVLETGQIFEFDVSYNASSDIITFTRPANLPNGKIMQFDIVRRPKVFASKVDANIKQITSRIENTATSQIDVTTRTAEGSIRSTNDKIVFTMNFRTSEYSKLVYKFNTIHNKNCFLIGTRINVAYLWSKFDINEGFDKYEIHGNEKIQKLINLEAILDDNKWYNETMYPYVYKDYPITPLLTLNDPMGIPPVNAVYIQQENEQLVLDPQSVAAHNYSFSQVSWKMVNYDIANYMDWDSFDLYNKIVRYYFNNLTVRMRTTLSAKTVLYYKDFYRVKVTYKIPGKDNPISEFQIQLNNPF